MTLQVDSQYLEEVLSLRAEFRQEVGLFLERAGIPDDIGFRVQPDAPDAAPAFLVTGASFTPYDPAVHGSEKTHAFAAVTGDDGQRYLMNNTAALAERLIQSGERVVIHSKSPETVMDLARRYGAEGQVKAIGGDLSDPSILRTIYAAFQEMADEQPVSDIRMALYQSFAQNNGEPFKPMHREHVEEVERAASRRLRFVYNMAAMGYDLLMKRGADNLRVVSLSALAANRATYGLLADAADKFMNELIWRTFHLEANISTGKPVTIYQVNPGITTACSTYRDAKARKVVLQESIADGFPLEKGVFEGRTPLPQISSHDVSWVVDSLLRTPEGANPNDAMPESVKSLLYGGFSPGELRTLLAQAVREDEQGHELDPDHTLPDHIITPGTRYGALPEAVQPGAYRRIPLTPPGQRF